MSYGIVLNISDEGPAALEYCLQNLQASGPVRVVTDGVDLPPYAALCEQRGVVYRPGEYLKRIECGGRWWERTLREGLETGCTSFYVNDARVLRSRWFTRKAAKRILQSGVLRSPELTELWMFCPDKDLIHLWYPLGYLDLDVQLQYVAQKISLKRGIWLFDRFGQPSLPPIETGVPDDTPIRIITTCKSRLEHLQQTVPTWLADLHTSVLVVDWSCPQETGPWVRWSLEDPRVEALEVPGQIGFNLSAARNAGARYAARYLPNGHAEYSDELWAFVDADVLLDRAWFANVRRTFRRGYYHVADPMTRNMGGTVVMHPSSFFAGGGYDETIQGWGADDTLFYLMLRHFGIRAGTYPGQYASAIRHPDSMRTKHYHIKDKKQSNRIIDHYYRLKCEFMMRTGYLPSVAECQAILEDARTRNYPPGGDCPLS